MRLSLFPSFIFAPLYLLETTKSWIELQFFFDQFNSTEVSLSIAVLLVNYNGNVNTESYSTEHVVSKKVKLEYQQAVYDVNEKKK